MKAIKIIQCSFGDGYAGSAKIAILSSEELKKRGHDVKFFVSKNSLTEKRGKEKEINTISFDTEKDKKVLFKEIEEEFKKLNPDFFIAYHSLDRKTGIHLKKKFKNNFINIAYRQNISKSTPIIGSFIYNRYYDYQIACSNGVANSLISSGIKKDKVKVIHNSIEIPGNLGEIDGYKIRQKHGLGDKFVLGLSTWFHKERKGFDILFDAFSKLKDEKFVLLIVGIPEEMQNEVIGYAKEFGIEKEKLIMPGYVENIWEYYKAMDVFLLPSRSEGFSLALLEAGAAKLPLIASNIPGNDEFIKDGENGFLFNLKNPDELKEKIEVLASSEEMRNRFGENAHFDVMNNYTIEKLVNKLENFLKTLS